MVSINKNQLMTAAKDLTAVAVGVGAFFTAISAKNTAITNRSLKYQFVDSISAIAGKDAAVAAGKVIFSNPGFGPGDLLVGNRQFNPFGFLNATSGAGILALIVDAVIDYFGIPGYSKVRGFVQKAALGLIVGGGLGGVFDPPDSGGLSYNPIQGSFPGTANAITGSPYARGAN